MSSSSSGTRVFQILSTKMIEENQPVMTLDGEAMGPKNFASLLDRSEVHQLASMYYFDTSKINPTDNPGRELKEYFNPASVNVQAVVYDMNSSCQFLNRVLLKSIHKIEPNEEIVLEKGKCHWIYLPTFLRQSKHLQSTCKQYYNLKDDEFIKGKTNRVPPPNGGLAPPGGPGAYVADGDGSGSPPTPATRSQRGAGKTAVAKK